MKRTILLLLSQLAVSLLLSAAAFLLKPIPALHRALLWGLLPLNAFASAFMLVRRGVNPYIGWIMPPVALTCAAYLISMGFLPSGGAMVLIAFLGIVGAATGDSYNKMRKSKHK